MRIDKFLWSVRLYKTRAIAHKAVDGSKVKLNDAPVKPSRTVAVGETFAIREKAVWRSFKILVIPKSRVGAKLVEGLITEITSDEDLQKLRDIYSVNRSAAFYSQKGRPTKKVRRDIDKLRGS